jgi:hypothetical protein
MPAWLSTALEIGQWFLLGLGGIALGALSGRPDKRDNRILQLEADMEDAFGRVKKLTGRLARQTQLAERDLPAADDEASDNAQRRGESDHEWKRRLRAKIVSGAIKHG